MSKLKEKNWEPSNSCTEEINFGDEHDIWTRFPDPQVKSEEWNLSRTGVPLSAEVPTESFTLVLPLLVVICTCVIEHFLI